MKDKDLRHVHREARLHRPMSTKASSASLARPKRVRVIDGPLRDATYDPSMHLTIGRGCDSDIQLIHDGVSRRHACITTDTEGRHVLVDLESTNGTFIDDQRIDRSVLGVGTIFEIVRNRFVYEEAPAPRTRDRFVPRQDGALTQRTTVAYSVFKGASTRLPRSRWPSGSGRGVVAPYDDSDPRDRHYYRGDLLADIAIYRSLRARFLRGEPQAPDRLGEFRRLELLMRPTSEESPPWHSKRAYRRFACRITARLRILTGEEFPVELTDLGVDGARVSVGSHSIMPQTLLWLAMERRIHGYVHTLVFPGRAAWTRRRHIGVSFSGTPGWSERGREQSFFQTRRDLGPLAADVQQDGAARSMRRESSSVHESGS